MVAIEYSVGDKTDSIIWAANEHFGELTDKTYNLGQMEAVEIAKNTDLSITAKILLSAVAGAIIQQLIDQGVPTEEIFGQGKFTIK